MRQRGREGGETVENIGKQETGERTKEEVCCECVGRDVPHICSR